MNKQELLSEIECAIRRHVRTTMIKNAIALGNGTFADGPALGLQGVPEAMGEISDLLESARQSAEARLQEAAEVIEPFAAVATRLETVTGLQGQQWTFDDSEPVSLRTRVIDHCATTSASLEIGDFCRARSFLQRIKEGA